MKSDNPSAFTFAVFEKNYCKNSRRGICKKIRNEEESSVYDICRAVQFNTMIVSLIGIRLRDSNNLSIKDCAKRICYGVGSIEGKVKYSKDLETKSLELIDILRFLFSDILKPILGLFYSIVANNNAYGNNSRFVSRMSRDYHIKDLSPVVLFKK